MIDQTMAEQLQVSANCYDGDNIWEDLFNTYAEPESHDCRVVFPDGSMLVWHESRWCPEIYEANIND